MNANRDFNLSRQQDARRRAGQPQRVEKHGAEVWSDVEMDAIRQARCLCLRCGGASSCANAKTLLAICKMSDLALMVTRCPAWSKDGGDSCG